LVITLKRELVKSRKAPQGLRQLGKVVEAAGGKFGRNVLKISDSAFS
jgi:hypothetical protein